MHFQSAAALALLTTAVVAEPRKAGSPKKKYSFKQVAARGKAPPPAVQILKAHVKYAAFNPVIPPHIKAAAKAQKKITASVQATPYDDDLAYLVPVVIGGTKFDLNFDTGSADLWTYSNLQPSVQQAGHAVYYPKKSGKVISGATWDITYGDGTGAKGVVYADAVTVGAMTATSQAVEAATSVSSDMYSDTTSDGIVGLAFSPLNAATPQQKTFMDTISPSLQAKLFTVTLKSNAPGFYDFGYINATRYTGSLYYSSVTPSGTGQLGYWMINTLSGYQVGVQSQVSSSLGNAVVDTGTTLMYLPDSLVNAYYAKISGAKNDATQGGWIFPCKAVIPALTLKIAGQWFKIPSKFLNYTALPSDANTCFGGLQSSNGIGMNILGDIFLKAMFVVFDQSVSPPRIGFAAQRL